MIFWECTYYQVGYCRCHSWIDTFIRTQNISMASKDYVKREPQQVCNNVDASKLTSKLAEVTTSSIGANSDLKHQVNLPHLVGANENGEKAQTVSYSATKVIGSGSFGVVFQATVGETGEFVAIKKVFQDKRFKNRELQIMRMLEHPNIVQLKHCFYSTGEKVRFVLFHRRIVSHCFLV